MNGIHQCRNVDLAVVSVLVELEVILSNYMSWAVYITKSMGPKTDPCGTPNCKYCIVLLTADNCTQPADSCQ